MAVVGHGHAASLHQVTDRTLPHPLIAGHHDIRSLGHGTEGKKKPKGSAGEPEIDLSSRARELTPHPVHDEVSRRRLNADSELS